MKRCIILSLAALVFITQPSLLFCEKSKCKLFQKLKSEKTDETKAANKNYPFDCQVLKPTKGYKQKSSGPYIDFSALIWQSKEGSLEYAGKSKVLDSSSRNSKQKEYIVIPDFGWRPGYKLDVGYIYPDDNWDNKLLWTYYKGEFTHVKKHTNVELEPYDNGVIPLFFYSTVNDSFDHAPRYEHATGDWSLYFNSVDFEIGRNSFVTRKLSMRLLFGIKGAWTRQYYKLNYSNGNTVNDDITLLTSNINFINNFWGVGPRIGLEAKCHLIWNFKLLANTSFASLLSHFTVNQKGNDTRMNTSASEYEVIPTILKDNFYAIKPTSQIMLGFEWARTFNKSYLGLSMGYEMQYFWGQNQIRRPLGNNNIAQTYSSRGDLQLHGLTANIKFEF